MPTRHSKPSETCEDLIRREWIQSFRGSVLVRFSYDLAKTSEYRKHSRTLSNVLSFGHLLMSHELHADVDFVRDTSAEALSLFYDMQRIRPVGQKLVDVFDLSEGLFETVKAGIQLRYPTADEREVFLRAVACRVPCELMILAYGWDPAAHD